MERDEAADYEGKAHELERTADDMEEPARDVKGSVKDARQDWESKKSDSQAPGAQEDPGPEFRGDEDEDGEEDGE